VNYLLGISGVDPIAEGLLFERFLSTERSTLPDIDIDVDTVVDTDNSLVGVTETPDSRLRTLHDKKWSEFWGRHEAMWASRDDRRVS
jgi:hypothetical protein